MTNIEVPLYRAKKIDPCLEDIEEDKIFIEGFLVPTWGLDSRLYNYTIRHNPNSLFIVPFDKFNNEIFEIDPTTLAIHHQGMLDSQGNKIFASFI